MNSYWFDCVQVPANMIINACEDITAQGFHIVSVINLNMVAHVPGSLVLGDGKPQVVPMVSVVVRIARVNNLRVCVKPQSKLPEAS